jgi:hypothetical protein
LKIVLSGLTHLDRSELLKIVLSRLTHLDRSEPFKILNSRLHARHKIDTYSQIVVQRKLLK